MLIVHDLVEIYAGDTPLYNTLNISKDNNSLYDVSLVKNKKEKEKLAAQKLEELLPNDLK